MIKTKVLLSQEEVIVGDIGYLVYPFGLLFSINLNYLDFKYFLTYLMKIIPDTTAGGLLVPIVLSSQ